MSQVMSKQLVSSSEGSAKRQCRAVTAPLWTVQILLALIFLFAGTNDPELNRQVPPRLTNDDIAALADPLNVPAVAAVAASFNRNGVAVYNGASFDGTIAGVSANYPAVRSAKIAAGTFFDQAAVDARSRVAVLGSKVRESLFRDEDPIGRRIRINDIGFEVVGVMAEKGGDRYDA